MMGPLRFLFLLLLLVGCRQNETAVNPPAQVPDPTPAATATVRATPNAPIDFITIATDAPNPPFADFNLLEVDAFGQLVGFDADIMQALADHLSWEYEFVVTSYEGMLESVARGDFDLAMSALERSATPAVPGIAYTAPYLEVGQVLVVRANERERQSYRDIQPGTPIGVVEGSAGERTAVTVVGVAASDLQSFRNTPGVLQALVDGVVDGAVIDSDDAAKYTTAHWQQLKVAGGNGRDAWITSQAYTIAVAAGNESLLNALNEAIAASESGRAAVIDRWLVAQSAINAGESLIGTPADQIVIGIIRQPITLDPIVKTPDLITWELLINTHGGLYRVDPANALVPLLVDGDPLVDATRVEYTFTLRSNVNFPDGRPVTAEDVKWSIDRAAGNGLSVVNGILKDSNDDGFADDDAVVVLNERQVKFVLQEATAYFLDLLATPPYFVLDSQCYKTTLDPNRNCAGLGQFSVVDWLDGEKLDLQANVDWPGPPPRFERVQLRLYPDTAAMRSSLDSSAIDIAWTGLTESDLSEMAADSNVRTWSGAMSFKSYLVFEQSQPPWDNVRLRQAVALSVDRDALAAIFGEQRRPLYSPVPDSSPGHLASEPRRDLNQARALLAQAGYSAANPLPMDLWYINDGRYGRNEAAYATALAAQIEESGAITVNLQGAPWETYRAEMSLCNYPSFLLGWPGPGQSPRSADPSAWLNYFITNTDNICSNYESPEMDTLLAAAKAVDPLSRDELFGAFNQIQLLWAEEYPALDLTQAPRIAVSLTNVTDVDKAVDALGLLHYGAIGKGQQP